jgi:hypothetical protein
MQINVIELNTKFNYGISFILHHGSVVRTRDKSNIGCKPYISIQISVRAPNQQQQEIRQNI